MIKDTFWELRDDYEEIDLRWSMLNAFMNPSPFSFPSSQSKDECMIIWDAVHHIIQNTLLVWIDSWYNMCKEQSIILQNLKPWVREKELWWVVSNLYEYANIAHNNIIPLYGNMDAMETKYQLQIECSWYLVNFSWTMDLIKYNYQWIPLIIDIKTSWSKWNNSKHDEQRQQMYYAYLYNAVRKTQDNIRFVYLVVTKQKKVQYQIMEKIITYEEAKKVLMDDIKIYLTNLKYKT